MALRTAEAEEAWDPTHSAWTTILQDRVSDDGRVDYKGLVEEPAPLKAYLRTLGRISEETFESWEESEQIAFLINLYNAATVALVTERYPVSSIRDIGGLLQSPWKLATVSLFGSKVSLDEIEHDRLRRNYAVPEIHFALVCAAMGCPPLRNEAFTGIQLQSQLRDQGSRFFRQKDKNYVDEASSTIHLSPIFKWFEADFKTRRRSRISIALDYMAPERPEWKERHWRVQFTPYDWSLNEQAHED